MNDVYFWCVCLKMEFLVFLVLFLNYVLLLFIVVIMKIIIVICVEKFLSGILKEIVVELGGCVNFVVVCLCGFEMVFD